ncbi:hypothetical protein QQP08_015628 [Theobroma cacao]|nr:hypothetical protein QQP08_015628 [Theobroma cacao]
MERKGKRGMHLSMGIALACLWSERVGGGGHCFAAAAAAAAPPGVFSFTQGKKTEREREREREWIFGGFAFLVIEKKGTWGFSKKEIKLGILGMETSAAW